MISPSNLAYWYKNARLCAYQHFLNCEDCFNFDLLVRVGVRTRAAFRVFLRALTRGVSYCRLPVKRFKAQIFWLVALGAGEAKEKKIMKVPVLMLLCMGVFLFEGLLNAGEHPLWQLLQYGKEKDIPAIKNLVGSNPKILEQAVTDQPSRHKGSLPIVFLVQTTLDFVEKLFEEVPVFKKYVNKPDSRGLTPLLWYAKDSRLGPFFIEQGADVNAIQGKMDDPYIRNAPLLQCLIGEYGYFKARHEYFSSSEESADKIQMGRVVDAIKLLLAHGADPSAKAGEIKIKVSLDPEKTRLFKNISAYVLAKELGYSEIVELFDKKGEIEKGGVEKSGVEKGGVEKSEMGNLDSALRACSGSFDALTKALEEQK
jgi:hypothetical protein